MKNKLDLVKFYVQDSKFDVFSLSETWLVNNLDTKLLDIHGYDFVRLDRNWVEIESTNPKRGGGVGAYIKSTLNYSTTDLSEHNISADFLELQWIKIRQHSRRDILIGIVYRPPQACAKKCIEYLNDICATIPRINRSELFLIGDFNVNYDDFPNPNRRLLKDFESLSGMKQLITSPTRFGQIPSTIDLIFTNSDTVAKSGVMPVNVSDHELIFVTSKKEKTKIPKKEVYGRSYLNYDCVEFQTILQRFDWSCLDKITDVDAYWDIIESRIRLTIDKLCPVKKLRVQVKNEPWITQELLEGIHDKHNLRKIAVSSTNEVDWARARKAKNEMKNNLRNAKADFIKENLNRHEKDSKKFWEQIKQLLNPKNGNESITLTNPLSGRPIDSNLTSDHLNIFFADIGPSLAQKFNQEWVSPFQPLLKQINDIQTEGQEVLSLCKNIAVHKSSSIETLSSRVLKDAFTCLPTVITKLFNLSLSTCKFPLKWKQTTIIPFHKGGPKDDVNNYRPISLLPLPGKLLEKIIHTRLMKFLEVNSILNPNQHGFRPGHSTIDVVANFTDDIYNAMNEGKCTLAVYIDFKKAFDTVNHNILIQKLYYLGIRNRTLDWITNYLTNRDQCTLANDNTSSHRLVTCGVPQGSILGPLLFLCYINDLPFVLRDSLSKFYADDTVVYAHAESLDIALRSLLPDIEQLEHWCTLNRLTVNTTKTKVMLFGSRRLISKNHHPPIHLNDTPLGYADDYKYLGVILDQYLNFRKHTQNIYKLAAHKVYTLSKIRPYITANAALVIHKTKILPFIDYGDIFYDSTYLHELDKLKGIYAKFQVIRGFSQKIPADLLSYDKIHS